MKFNAILIAFTLIIAFTCKAFAHPEDSTYVSEDDISDSEENLLEREGFESVAELDSAIIDYEGRVAGEDKEASYGKNRGGMCAGAMMTVGASVLLAKEIHTFKTTRDVGELATSYFMIIALPPVILAGVIVFGYNGYKYGVRKEHANKRDRYKKTLDRYKSLRESVQIMVIPTVDFVRAGGGFNATLLF